MTLSEHIKNAKKEYVQRVLNETNGNISEAAKVAGRNRQAFYEVVEQCGVDAKMYRLPRKLPAPTES